MNIHTKFKFLEDHFIIIWIVTATCGYVILSVSGHLDFKQYVVFLWFLIGIYMVLKKQAIFWFFFLFYVLYLILIRANFIESTTVAKIDAVFSKSAHDIIAMVKSTVR